MEFVESKKDLGVIVTSSFPSDSHIDHIYSKASSRMGLLKRALHFVKCPKQKRVFYLAVVRNLFEHCVQIWRPSSDTGISQLERIQKRAVKWILAEQNFSYNDLEYLTRLRDLDLIPMKYKLIFNDLTLFHNIFYNKIDIKLPQYYTKYSVEENVRLRKCIKPPEYFGSNAETINLQIPRRAKYNELSLKCTLDTVKMKYKSSFFFRTVQEWNRHLPDKNIRNIR